MNLATANRAAVLLAGGDGTRLGEYIRKIAGSEIPKQFFSILGEVPLLEQTRRRVSISVAPQQTFYALNRKHEKFFSPLLAEADVRPENLIIQPRNRGTAPAILYALLRVAEVMPQASVVLMPSDHRVDDEAALMSCVDEAFETVELRPELTILLGAAPDEPEPGYGWIEPGSSVTTGTPCEIFRVRRFWEKPSREVATRLMSDGCLWNTFIIVSRLSTLLGLFVVEMPELYLSFRKIKPSLLTSLEPAVIGRLYDDLRCADFSRHVLEPASANLCVMQMKEIGWTDLGEPRRIAKVLGKLRIHQKWDVA